MDRMKSDDAEKWEAKLTAPLPGEGFDDDDDWNSGQSVITASEVNSF